MPSARWRADNAAPAPDSIDYIADPRLGRVSTETLRAFLTAAGVPTGDLAGGKFALLVAAERLGVPLEPLLSSRLPPSPRRAVEASNRCFVGHQRAVCTEAQSARAGEQQRAVAATATVLTYNILAPSLGIGEKHSYCPMELRVWGDAAAGRCARVVAEIVSYGADVVCLQECPFDAFEQLRSALAPSGLDDAHHASEEVEGEEERALAKQSATGLAVFVRSAAWQTMASSAVRLGAGASEDRYPRRKLRKTLRSLKQMVQMVRLRHRGSGAHLVAGSTHLYFDPRAPHLRAAQAELACAALRAFVVGTSYLLRGADGSNSGGDVQPMGLVLVGDLNSPAALDPGFLHPAQRASLPSPPPRGGTYELLASGVLPPSHPEHPDAFGREPVAKSNRAERASKDAGSQAGGRRRKGKPRDAAPLPVGPLCTELSLKDAYDGALAPGGLPLSTHAGDFHGCLDYIWVSAAQGGEVATCAVHVSRVLGMPYDARAPEFHAIPDAAYPSDHLALAAEIAIAYRNEKVHACNSRRTTVVRGE